MELVDKELMIQLGETLRLEDMRVHQRDGVQIRSEGPDLEGVDFLEHSHGPEGPDLEGVAFLEDSHALQHYESPGFMDDVYKRFKDTYLRSKAQYAKKFPNDPFPPMDEQWGRFQVSHARELGLSEQAVRAEFAELYPGITSEGHFSSWMDMVPQARRTLGYQEEHDRVPEDLELKRSEPDEDLVRSEVELDPIDEMGPELGDDLARLQSGGDYSLIRREPISSANLREGMRGLSSSGRTALVSEFAGADIMVNSVGKMFVNFGKGLAQNAAAAAAMFALGYAIPESASKYVNYAFDAWAIAELFQGNPAMAVITAGMELWKEFSTQSKRCL